MLARRALPAVLSYLWKAALCAVPYAGSAALSRWMLSFVGLPGPVPPGTYGPEIPLVVPFLIALAIALGLLPLARNLRGGFVARWLVIAGFAYGFAGLGNAVEAALFTNARGVVFLALVSLPPSLVLGALAALVLGPGPGRPSFSENFRQFWEERTLRQWTARLILALAAFPAIYYAAALLVPLVAGIHDWPAEAELSPPMPATALLATRVICSTVFLLAVIPVCAVWGGTRRSLVGALWAAIFVLTLLPLIMPAFWVHVRLGDENLWGGMCVWYHAGAGDSLEILLLCLVYAWVLVALLLGR